MEAAQRAHEQYLHTAAAAAAASATAAAAAPKAASTAAAAPAADGRAHSDAALAYALDEAAAVGGAVTRVPLQLRLLADAADPGVLLAEARRFHDAAAALRGLSNDVVSAGMLNVQAGSLKALLIAKAEAAVAALLGEGALWTGGRGPVVRRSRRPSSRVCAHQQRGRALSRRFPHRTPSPPSHTAFSPSQPE